MPSAALAFLLEQAVKRNSKASCRRRDCRHCRCTNTLISGASVMNSFTLTAIGNLARDPELMSKGEKSYARLCLVGNDYAGKDEESAAREVTTSLWFVAFGPLGETIARNARKGDQLIIEARIRASNWTDEQGEKQYDHSFIVQGFRFGAPGRAKREELEARRGEERPAGVAHA
ncbi:MAG TPA: single-stranded DNA-binding protein [Steroidobacteraceae bacterium]|nr:single-stranded DNA-binding protein [Steroidobacteraceae bacterium]